MASGLNGAGLRLFDLAKPETPREFSRFETPAVLSKIVIVGNYAYVHYIFWENEGGEEIDIVDISNPAHPLQVGRYAAPPFRPDQLSDSAGSNSDVDLAALLDTDRIQDFAIAGDLMYVASGDCLEVLAGCQGNLRLVDISKPTSPHEIGVYEAAGSVQEVALNGDYAYFNVRLGEDNHTLHILDISQPTRPVEVGSYADQTGDIGPMAVIERKHKIYAYLTRPYQGVDIIDVSDASAPEKVSSWAEQENISKLTILGDYAYFDSSILNISNPIAPREIGRGEGTLHLPQADIIGIEKSSNSDRIYAFFRIEDSGGLEVFDVTDPAAPIRIGSYFYGGFNSVAVTEDFIGAVGSGLYLFRLSSQ